MSQSVPLYFMYLMHCFAVQKTRICGTNFARLHLRWTWPGTIHLWAFDLHVFNGRDLRPQALVKRQARLQTLLERFGCPAVSLSEPFEDGLALLRVAEERGLEGVVSKRRNAPYR